MRTLLLLLLSLASGPLRSHSFAFAPRVPPPSLRSTSSSHLVQPTPRSLPLTSLRSEPSDTSSDGYYEYVDVESEESIPTQDEALVLNVLDLIPGGGNSGTDNAGGSWSSSVTEETRAAINEALYKLEALHQPTTPSPAVSPLLNGVWQLRYVGGYASDWTLPSPTRQLALFLYSGGYSPGIFALGLAQTLPRPLVDVGSDLEIAISRSQVRRSLSLSFFLFSLVGTCD